ncbi:MAG TPA: zf-HC2 domain-containing protein [Thermoanaerobaculia bacterium]|nr:zf-HC2 domain-containing protein [Thermoanaerobaculia bacterium]
MTSDDGRRLGHQEAWELLPWYVNGTLGSDERQAVEVHLDRCPLCRSELAASRELAFAVRAAEESPQAVELRLERLLDRLEPPATAQSAPPRVAPRRRGDHLRPAVRWVLALQAAALLVLTLGLGSLLARQPPGPTTGGFRTLAAAPVEAVTPGHTPTVRAVFSPTASEAELRRLLLAVEARLIDGPSAAGVYTLQLVGEAPEAALERLRAAPLVELAEAVIVRRATERDGTETTAPTAAEERP